MKIKIKYYFYLILHVLCSKIFFPYSAQLLWCSSLWGLVQYFSLAWGFTCAPFLLHPIISVHGWYISKILFFSSWNDNNICKRLWPVGRSFHVVSLRLLPESPNLVQGASLSSGHNWVLYCLHPGIIQILLTNGRRADVTFKIFFLAAFGISVFDDFVLWNSTPSRVQNL